MFVLPEGLPVELAPLAFLVGKWSGTGVIAFEGAEHEFVQQIEFAHDGNVLTYISSAKLNDESGTALPSELGYWRIARPREEFDFGPGLLPGTGDTKEGAFNLEVSTIHPGGVAELYNGWVKQARIELASAHGVAFEGAKTYRHSTRIYGLVEGALLWAWDIALPGQELKSHASARLERV
ncbi:MAG: hypothetical protein RL166_854 [Actinomycetota bacterium]